MNKSRKWTKLAALAVVAAMAVVMLASCQTGGTYEELAGDESVVTVIGKDANTVVPYTGDPVIVVIDTDDPQYATGNNGSNGDNNGGSSDDNNDGSSGDNNGGSNGDNNGGSNGGDNNGGSDSDDLAPDESGTAVSMLSQNLRATNFGATNDGANNTLGFRQYRFQKLVETYDPDVIATQEVTPDWLEALYALLPDYTVHYKWRSESNKEGTPVLYKTSKYECVESGHFWLSETPNVESPSYGEEGIVARITSWVRLKDKTTGSEFYFYSTHFGLGGGQVVRGAGNQIAETFSSLPPGSYAFVMGDFNDAYQSKDYLSYMDYVRIVDLRDVASEMSDAGICEIGEIRTGTMNGFREEENYYNGGGGFIDHCMAKPNAHLAVDFYGVLYDRIEVESESVPLGYVSDHFGVLCNVRIDTTPSYADYYAL